MAKKKKDGKDVERSEEDEKLFRLDNLLGEVEDIEREQYGVKKKKKAEEEELSVDLPGPIKLEPPEKAVEEVKEEKTPAPQAEKPVEEVKEGEEEVQILDENGEPCDQCTVAAKKFIEDKFCSLVDDDEHKEVCIVEAMKLVADVKSGKISMHEFEKKVKELGKKFIPDWQDEEDVKEIIPSETKEELTRDD